MNPVESPTPDPNGFLTKRELAVRLKMTVRTVENWQRRGILPYMKIGKVVRFHWPEVIQHLKANYRYNRRLRLAEVPV